MAEQLRLPFGPAPKRGVSFLRQGARAYSQRQGRTYDPTGLDEIQSDSQWQTKVGQKYMQTVNNIGLRGKKDPTTARAYEALRAETHQQFDYLTKPRTQGGLGVSVSFEPEDYDNPLYQGHEDLAEDIVKNRRLRVAATVENGSDTGASHPYLDPDTNNKFRAVHDAFGHAAIGRSFSRHGEEAAYQSHRQMYSPLAGRALVTETRGQNSAMIYGGAEGFPDNAPKVMPAWTTRDRMAKVKPPKGKKLPQVVHPMGQSRST